MGKQNTIEALLIQQAKALPFDKRKEIIMSFKETELHDYLKKLFELMEPDYIVEITHGINEYGKDLVIVKKDSFGSENKITIIAYNLRGIVKKKDVIAKRDIEKGDIYAVVIGINQYPKVQKLKYATQDALSFAKYLVDNMDVPEANITLLLDETATLSKIKQAMGTELKKIAGRKDMVIIYYSGHGAAEPDSQNPDGDGLEKYILPYDVDPEDLYSSALPMREIVNIFNRISAERLIFIADTCYGRASGGKTILASGRKATTLSDQYLSRIAQGKGRMIFAASGANEISMEKDDLSHGVFTYFLLEGLESEADSNHDNLISIGEIFNYVSQKVPAATEQNQHPTRSLQNEEGEVIIGRVK